EGVYLYDIDSIRSVAEQSLALRRQQVAAAEAIIADHVTEFLDSIPRGLNRFSQAPTGRSSAAISVGGGGAHTPIGWQSEGKWPTPQWSVILPLCTRIKSTDSK